MAPTPVREIRIDHWRSTALDAIAYDRHSDVTAEITAAVDDRLAQWRSGDLPEHENAELGETLELRLKVRLSDERYGALGKLAEERGGGASREIRAAIDDRLTRWRAGRITVPEPPADPGPLPWEPIVVPDDRQWTRPDALEDAREDEGEKVVPREFPVRLHAPQGPRPQGPVPRLRLASGLTAKS